MNSRERVSLAIEHKIPDRVPIDFGGLVSTININGPYGYKALCKYLGIDDYIEPQVNPLTSCVDNPDPRIYERFHSDIRHIIIGGPAPEKLPNGDLKIEYGSVYRTASLPYPPTEFAPLRNMKEISEIEEYQDWPDPDDPRLIAGKKEEAQLLRETTECAIMAMPGLHGLLVQRYQILRGFEQWCIDMMESPKFYDALLNKLVDISIDVCRTYFGAVGPYIDIIEIDDDMGWQGGTLMSLKDYKTFVKPYTQRFLKEIRAMVPHAKLMLHSDGSVYPFIGEFIDLGFELLNPIQVQAKDMEPWRLKKEFGDKMCFLGGIDTQTVLPRGTVEDVRNAVKGTIAALAPNGGYILASVHNIMPEVKPENVVAMFDAAIEFGKY
ncbi:MAG: uroporphyrinogen decarboxylase family protein [Candidatus Humimicrobiaceae bacterium]